MISISNIKKCPDCSHVMTLKESFEDEVYYSCPMCGYEEFVDADSLIKSLL